MYATLLTNLENGILTITINRPDKLNALNKQVFDDIDTAMSEVYHNDDIKSAIITGAGSKAFVAGADIAEFASFSKKEAVALSKRGQDVFFKIENSPSPTTLLSKTSNSLDSGKALGCAPPQITGFFGNFFLKTSKIIFCLSALSL